MKETGILFTPDNHRLILSGNKTQTRRVITPQPPLDGSWRPKAHSVFPNLWLGYSPSGLMRNDVGPDSEHCEWKCPYGSVGDRLYVKEGVITHCSIPQLFGYYMDGCRATEPWMTRRTAMFMPKSMARTWLEITEVRVERVQDISEEDAIAEGMQPSKMTEKDIADMQISDAAPHIKELARILGTGHFTAKFNYQMLWDSINKKKHPWSSNPWVWVIAFKRVQR